MTYLVVDFEALCHKDTLPAPTDIGVCLIQEDGRVQDEPFFDELIRPDWGKPNSFDVELTGITPEMLASARSSQEVFTDLNALCAELPDFRVIAHNAKFDRRIALQYATYLPVLVQHPWLDTIHVAKKKLILPSYSLDPLAAALELSIVGNRHRAYPDAHLTARAFAKMRAMPDHQRQIGLF